MASTDRDVNAALAATRFGMGAKPGEIASAARDPQGFLRDQIRSTGADLPDLGGAATPARLAEYRQFQQERQQVKKEIAATTTAGQAADPDAKDPVKMARRLIRDEAGGDFLARARLGATTDAGFRERWALFWANHFTVSATKVVTATIAGPYENEAIRPHVFGRFADLLASVETHPAMLLYLDQVYSIGPDSPAAEMLKRRQEGFQNAAMPKRLSGLNENLAREIMELHTVGVDGGYTQADVTEFARAMTGISIGGFRGAQDQVGDAVFREAAHEPGTRHVMNVSYSQGGRGQAAAILADLADKPATAKFVCRKIARHFIADDPPPALTARLEAAWTGSRGDLSKVAQALISAPEAWDPTPRKFKTPYDYIVSSYRAAGVQPSGVEKIAPILTALGQKPFSAPSPKGWAEDTGDWAAPDAIVKRMQFAQAFSAVAVQDRDPKVLAADALGAELRPQTALAVARAESRAEGLALLLMSPEFQRR